MQQLYDPKHEKKNPGSTQGMVQTKKIEPVPIAVDALSKVTTVDILDLKIEFAKYKFTIT